jgi:para-nitrobenzyl esterase
VRSRLILLAVGILSLVVPHATGRADSPCPAAEDVVCTAEGAVRGTAQGDLLSFLGIPYAQPPLGDLRWRPPQPVEPWRDVRAADRFGPICPQFVGKEIRGDEDCLTVNVWRPRERPKGPLPVMVWLTGGGNHSLSGEGTSNFGGVRYEGSRLVPAGVLLVTYNLRLGPLGFLTHPALDVESADRVSGNYGSLDQIAMLSWVRRNIAAFGGDPHRVFLFGTSAGGGNICALMSAPGAAGLFQAAAMQSSVPSGCEMQTLSEAEHGTGQEVARTLGCVGAGTAACLRAKDYREIIAALPGNFSVLPRRYGPVVDGHVFPEQPVKRLLARRAARVPIIIGNDAGETTEWADSAGAVKDATSYAGAIEAVFGRTARAAIEALYPASAYPSARDAFARLTTDALFTCTSRRVADAFARSGSAPVYRYLFARALENDPIQKARGAVHTVEHPFFFGWRGSYRPSEADLAIQRDLIGYWTAMAATGDPNGGDRPDWPRMAPDQDAYLVIGPEIAAQTGDGGAHCDFWDRVPPLWPHM